VGDSAEPIWLSPVFTGSKQILTPDPGARAPGFMLTPASQAKEAI